MTIQFDSPPKSIWIQILQKKNSAFSAIYIIPLFTKRFVSSFLVVAQRVVIADIKRTWWSVQTRAKALLSFRLVLRRLKLAIAVVTTTADGYILVTSTNNFNFSFLT